MAKPKKPEAAELPNIPQKKEAKQPSFSITLKDIDFRGISFSSSDRVQMRVQKLFEKDPRTFSAACHIRPQQYAIVISAYRAAGREWKNDQLVEIKATEPVEIYRTSDCRIGGVKIGLTQSYDRPTRQVLNFVMTLPAEFAEKIGKFQDNTALQIEISTPQLSLI